MEVHSGSGRLRFAVNGQSMSQATNTNTDLTWGIALLLVGGFFLYFAGDIKLSGAVNESDPGPRAIPIAMSLTLLLGGVISLGSGFHNRDVGRATNGDDRAGHWPSTVVFATLTLGYIACAPFAFYTSTSLFSFLAIVWFRARWWVAALAAIAITTVVWVLFAQLFSISLPTLLEWFSQ